MNTAAAALASFRAEPQKGHLKRAKRVVGYLVRFNDATIRFRTEGPGMPAAPATLHEWKTLAHDNASELLPEDAPAPKGKYAVTISHYDANIYHNVITGRLVTGVLHFFQQNSS